MSALRWGVLGTANIARAQFLPAVRETGQRAVLVAGRDGDAAAEFAREHGVERSVQGYAAVIEDPEVDAVYVPLPNPLHAEWTTAALRAGKAVLCEKPLCLDPDQVEEVLAVAATAEQPLWEAFVFPFQAQHRRVVELLADGAIGELREIVGSFHFEVGAPGNIRLSRAMGGGALADVGCYPMRLAHELFAAPAGSASVVAVHGEEVEVDASAVLTYPDDRRLLLTCGFRRSHDTTTVLLGTEGSLRLDNPYHPIPGAALEVRRPGSAPVVESPTRDARSFSAALRHVAAALAGAQEPAHTAATSALPVARALRLAQSAVPAP
ncbi:Gfo/Idh/MocA family oxidoreductase [Phycicoccus sp. MAQZ13P-2]|uniref:Gfo/Idh/MocA family protein n=1 Tax=Phycicoccus TaxID=367298 RepID=UPI001A8F1363|nr:MULTISPECIES: Gfo/Idh/MocA family oxidoreductase [Phycicoccus]MBT9254711.1 Gfo/Idh/MocA family oxidoreductase [Phycicoccus mangrovi]MBT9273084.1 Gfo/Idh/MocA family oxidoreductase [Phycicoccus mangrovi]GIL34224.1 oxidoreductase [Phycicoccus sp. DTK01]